MLLVIKQTGKEIDDVAPGTHKTSFVSTNPRVSNWLDFLADAQRFITNPNFRSDPTKPAAGGTAYAAILANTETQIQAASTRTVATIRAGIVNPTNKLIEDAPWQAYRTGRAFVRKAMVDSGEGTPTGQAAALSGLDASFVNTWQPIRTPIIVPGV